MTKEETGVYQPQYVFFFFQINHQPARQVADAKSRDFQHAATDKEMEILYLSSLCISNILIPQEAKSRNNSQEHAGRNSFF